MWIKQRKKLLNTIKKRNPSYLDFNLGLFYYRLQSIHPSDTWGPLSISVYRLRHHNKRERKRKSGRERANRALGFAAGSPPAGPACTRWSGPGTGPRPEAFRCMREERGVISPCPVLLRVAAARGHELQLPPSAGSLLLRPRSTLREF